MNFLDSLVGRKNTVKTQSCLFKKHIKPHLSPQKAKTATVTDLKELLNKWSYLSPQTKKLLLRLTARYIKFHGGEVNIKGLISSIHSIPNPPKSLNTNEANKFLRLCETDKDPDFYIIVLLALHAGLRKGEIFGLKENDIDLKNGVIKVQRSYDGPTKNGKPRIIPLSKKLYEQFHKRNYKGRDKFLFRRYDPHKKIKRMLEKIGAIDKSCHSLRHTFATLGLDSETMTIKQMQELLGHSNPSTTIDLYWSNTKKLPSLGFLPGED